MQMMQRVTRTTSAATKDTMMMIGSWIESLGELVGVGGEVVGEERGLVGSGPAGRGGTATTDYIMDYTYITDYILDFQLKLFAARSKNADK